MVDLRKSKIIFLIVTAMSIVLYVFTDLDYAAPLILALLLYFAAAIVIGKFVGGKPEFAFSSEYKNEGGLSNILFKMRNTGLSPIFLFNYKIKAENILTGESKILCRKESFLPRQSKTELFSLSDSCCGCLRVSLEDSAFSDPLRLFEKSFKADEEIAAEYYLLPVLNELTINIEDLSKYDMESYRYSQAAKGDDPSEIFGIRDYHGGDNIKTIHWKLSCKTDTVVVKERSLPIDNKLMMIADKRFKSRDNFSVASINSATETFVSLSYTLIKKGVAHSVGWYDNRLDMFEYAKVESVDDIYRYMPTLLSSPFGVGGMSSADHYMESDSDKNHSTYIYVTAENTDVEADIVKLRGYGEVEIYKPENFKQ